MANKVINVNRNPLSVFPGTLNTTTSGTSNVTDSVENLSFRPQIYDTGDTIDDIINGISINLKIRVLTKDIGEMCFKEAGFENIPNKSEIKKIKLSNSEDLITVSLKSSEKLYI